MILYYNRSRLSKTYVFASKRVEVVDFKLSTEMKRMNLSLIHGNKANTCTMHFASNATTDSSKMAE